MEYREITLGDPKIGVTLGNNFVLKLGDEHFKMIKVAPGKVLLKGTKNKFLLERVFSFPPAHSAQEDKEHRRLREEFVYINLWGQRTFFSPPQIHLLRALLGMKCTCKMCRMKRVGR